MSHLQLMIKSYIQEVGLVDVDIATVLKKKPTAVSKEAPKDLEKLKPWKICKEGSFLVYQSWERTEANFCRSNFYLEDKHLYNTTCLEFILDLITMFKGNHKYDVKCSSDMILWYIQVLKMMQSFIPKIYGE